jgi:hypothetical protein
MSSVLRHVGKSTDGRPVFAGVQIMTGTHGVPLEMVLGMFEERGWVVDWLDYMEGALKDGANPRTIRARILSAVGEVYGPQYLRGFTEELDRWFP